ncbi:hypothetical protein L1887_31237 [Cichorium endivia]|nr:hypothetical protein L1887_31237 [Cichorium endivia]
MRNLCTFIVAAIAEEALYRSGCTKFAKLEGVVPKIYSQLGVIKENGLWMPDEEETGKTRGYRFIEYNTSQSAQRHTLFISSLSTSSIGGKWTKTVEFCLGSEGFFMYIDYC